MTTASFPSITATTEFVVPRSMPMILAIGLQILLTGGNVRRRPDLSNADLADPGGLLRSRPAAPRATRPRVGLPLAPRPVQVRSGLRAATSATRPNASAPIRAYIGAIGNHWG